MSDTMLGWVLQEEEDLKKNAARMAALLTIQKLKPSNKVTVSQFFELLQTKPELWKAVKELPVLELVEILLSD